MIIISKIKISFKNNKVTFSIYKEKNKDNLENLNLTQTNIINTESMVFTSNYMLKSPEIITTFLKGIAIQRNINKVYINDFDIIPVVLLVIQNIVEFNELYLLPEESINYDIYEKLLFSPNIKLISCHNMKHFMLEKLDQNNVTVIMNEKMDFPSNFMHDNDLHNYSSIYYKRSINIKQEMNDSDFEDFEIFCRINKYLKTINLYYYSQEVIRVIVKKLIQHKIKNIKILIYENKNNFNYLLSSIEYLKLIKNKLKDDFNFSFKIIYSEEYKKENFLAQVNITNIKLTSLIIIIVVILGFIIMEYNAFISERNIERINEMINKEIVKISDKISSDKPSSTIIVSNDNISSMEIPVDSSSAYKEAFDEIFNVLKEKNKDTVGWIKVNNTNIEYPVVQSKDNIYYLSNDFYKNKNSYGWIFMDYRNNPKVLHQNTILYGHNSYKKVMFTDLTKTLNKDWYLNKTNQIITYNSIESNMEWQIFSIYSINVTSDYLYVDFDGQKKFLEFANYLKKRSIHDFEVEIMENDKILTLSTCLNNGRKRVVVHAKLIQK